MRGQVIFDDPRHIIDMREIAKQIVQRGYGIAQHKKSKQVEEITDTAQSPFLQILERGKPSKGFFRDPRKIVGELYIGSTEKSLGKWRLTIYDIKTQDELRQLAEYLCDKFTIIINITVNPTPWAEDIGGWHISTFA